MIEKLREKFNRNITVSEEGSELIVTLNDPRYRSQVAEYLEQSMGVEWSDTYYTPFGWCEPLQQYVTLR